ncbi:hypothetical protein ACFLXU_07590 [Chloroflexota bacterium]
MAKNPLITDDVRLLIATVYLENPEFRAKEIRNEVEARLRRKNPKTKPEWPGLSAVQKELTRIRSNIDKRPPKLKELDTPWSIGSLVQYDIPPEALPMVLRVCAQRNTMGMTVRAYNWRRRQDVMAGSPMPEAPDYNEPFSIRDALWVSRLSKLTSDPQDIWNLAAWCSAEERAYEAIGKSIDIVNIDSFLLRRFGLEQSEESKGGTL